MPGTTFTWELWIKLLALYKLWGIKKRVTKVYSEASIGKGVYEELGILSFFGFDQRTKRNTRNLEFDPKVLGIAMEEACSAVEARPGIGT
jgi:hypothetical protein